MPFRIQQRTDMGNPQKFGGQWETLETANNEDRAKQIFNLLTCYGAETEIRVVDTKGNVGYFYSPTETQGDTTMTTDPRDTNAFSPVCSECGKDNSRMEIRWWNICCYPANMASDSEIAELAKEYVGPMSDEELTDAINVEIFGIPQPNTQVMLSVETLRRRKIPGVWPLETYLQRGFSIDTEIPATAETPAAMILARRYSETDADWLIGYHAQGGGI